MHFLKNFYIAKLILTLLQQLRSFNAYDAKEKQSWNFKTRNCS